MSNMVRERQDILYPVSFSKSEGAGDFNGIGYAFDVWLFEYDGELHLEDATTDEVAEEKILGDISFQEQFFYGKLYK